MLVLLLALVSAAPVVDLETLVDPTNTFPVAETLCSIAEERRLATLEQLLVNAAAQGDLDMFVADITDAEIDFLAKRGYIVSGSGAPEGSQTIHSLGGNVEKALSETIFNVDWSVPCDKDFGDYGDVFAPNELLVK